MKSETKPLRYVDGWYTDDPSELLFHLRDARHWNWLKQLALDAKSWKVWSFWLAGLAPLAAGAALRSPRTAIAGLAFAPYVLSKYVHMLRKVVSGTREEVHLAGTVRVFDRRHPLLRTAIAGELMYTDERVRERVMAILPEWVVKTHAAPDGSMRVLVAHSPTAEFSQVIGIRLEREGKV